MDKIFISGSRKISRLNKDIKKRLYKVVEKGFIILVGDANGIDKAVQRFMHERNYKNVFVYHSGDSPRNNIGNWNCNRITHSSMKKDFKFYVAKDLEMVQQAKYAFCIWDGKSKGTLHNIRNLLISRKQVLLYFYPHRIFYTLKTIGELESLMTRFVIESTVSTGMKKVQKHYQPALDMT